MKKRERRKKMNLLQLPRRRFRRRSSCVLRTGGEIRFSEIYRGITMPPLRALRLSFSPVRSEPLSSREERSRIYRGAGRKKKCPTCKMQRRVGGFSFSPPVFALHGVLRQFIRDFGSNPAGYRSACARPIFFTISFFLSAVFHAAGLCGFYRIYPENNAV